jgi:O-antigen ligase
LATSALPEQESTGVTAPAEPTWRRPGAVAILALALPILFLHVDYQPGFSVGFGSTSATVDLSDIVVWVVAVTALVVALRDGFAPLRAGRTIWVALGLYLLWIVVSVGYGSRHSGYAGHAHAISAAKWIEYALLALAFPLLVRRRRDLHAILAVLTVWSIVASAVGLVQFFGVRTLGAYPAGRRQPSFLGHNDFAALSALILLAGLWLLVFEGRTSRRFTVPMIVSGIVGVVLAGATAGLIGVGAAAVALAAVGVVRGALHPRLALVGALVVGVCALGVVALRGNDYKQFLRFVRIEQREQSTSANIQTYSQRTLLVYIGARIFRHHVATGVGFDGSNDFFAYGPELPATHRRFPHVAALAFPAKGRSYGVQNLYVQTLADLGIVGALLLVGVVAAGLVVPLRAAIAGETTGALAAAWLLAALGLFIAQGYVAGLPLDALFFLALGLAAARRQPALA